MLSNSDVFDSIAACSVIVCVDWKFFYIIFALCSVPISNIFQVVVFSCKVIFIVVLLVYFDVSIIVYLVDEFSSKISVVVIFRLSVDIFIIASVIVVIDHCGNGFCFWAEDTVHLNVRYVISKVLRDLIFVLFVAVSALFVVSCFLSLLSCCWPELLLVLFRLYHQHFQRFCRILRRWCCCLWPWGHAANVYATVAGFVSVDFSLVVGLYASVVFRGSTWSSSYLPLLASPVSASMLVTQRFPLLFVVTAVPYMPNDEVGDFYMVV